MIRKYKNNPIIKPDDIKNENYELEVFGVFNPGATKYKDKIILLLRVALKPREENGWIKVLIADKESDYKLKILKWKKRKSLRVESNDIRFIDINDQRYLSSLSVFYLAWSNDGLNFSFSEKPVFQPADDYEVFGIEDPRITKINDNYFITYTAVSENGFCAALASTKDFISFDRIGIIFPPENKDVALFPKKINKKYYALHRPTNSFIGKPSIWISESENLIHWGNHRILLTPLRKKWERMKIGAGPEPILTEQGWLVLYHSCGDNEVYSMNAILLDRNLPDKIIGRTDQPLLVPEFKYEKAGVVQNVVFSNGWISFGNKILIYYGAADKYIALAEASIYSLISLIKRY
ncbi:glycoside hydrolase family 130 protein [Ignavibacterium sp.]|jgi:predicted GH43/DUF377 family glycosyl hydrolase|uniref:glycoside hydrolase family 130 protein n=1 Tax=Ignavibacterium sp. TaxID=2651167 RepID=UPI0025C31547|nr:glycoside hydrolase family 130 protein [Ignavibacterium sp.]